MAEQLPLTTTAGELRRTWTLDERTREAGRRGIASASLLGKRPALRSASVSTVRRIRTP